MDSPTDLFNLADNLEPKVEGIASASVTHQDLSESFEIATAQLPLEPPESGDFHESFAIRDGSGDVGVLLGDVTGHGAPAAVKADIIRRTAIAQLQSGASALETVEAANKASQGDDDRFATFFVGRITGKGTLNYANAGHEPPIVVQPNGDTQVLPSTGPPLGVVAPDWHVYTDKKADLNVGDTLVMTTDGVAEARKPDEGKPVFFGHDMLVALLKQIAHLSPVKIVATILSQVLAFSRSVLHDDFVIMALRRKVARPNSENDTTPAELAS
jgi:serine phosphatase RsbU (regulator of sigma subunit)